MNLQGLIIGAAAFALIGIFHPIVIKTEYYLGADMWPVFMIGGVGSIIISAVCETVTVSAITAILGFCMLWSILELKEQEERVRKGWFPANPDKNHKRERIIISERCIQSNSDPFKCRNNNRDCRQQPDLIQR